MKIEIFDQWSWNQRQETKTALADRCHVGMTQRVHVVLHNNVWRKPLVQLIVNQEEFFLY